MNLQLDLQPTVTRIRDSVPALKLVGGAAEFENATNAAMALPAAFVLPARDRGGSSPFGNQIVEQQIDSEFAVVLAVRNLSDSTGSAAAQQSLKPVRDAVADALINWPPDPDFFGCEFSNGQLTLFENGVIWWTDTYRTSHLIRSQ